jgi:hypothetical protein
MDINLPGLSGFELTSKFRNQPELKDTPIIALTAKTQKTDRETALVAGCNGFIPKPIDPFNFVSQIKTYLSGHQERLDKGAEGRALRKFNVHLLEHLEQQLREAHEYNQKLIETQQILETTNKGLNRLVALSQGIMREYDTWQIAKKVMHSLFLEIPCDSFTMYFRHPSNSYWEGLHLVEGELEQAPVLQDNHPFIQKLHYLDTNEGWLHGPPLLAMPIWIEGYQLDIWLHNSQPCLLLYLDRKNQGIPHAFWAFDRTSDRPFLPIEFEMVQLFGRLAQVCHENAEMVREMDEKSKALSTSYEHLEHAYRDLQKVKTELQTKDREEVVKDLFIKTAEHLKEPVETLNHGCQFLIQSLNPEDLQTKHTLQDISLAATQVEAVFQGFLRRTRPDTISLPEWIDLESLIRNEIAFMEVEGLLLANQMQIDINLFGARIYGIYSDFTRLLRVMVINSIPSQESLSQLRQFRVWREESHVYLQIQDNAGNIHPKAIELAFDPFQGQRESMPGARSPHASLPQCLQTLSTYDGSIDLKNTEDGVLLKAMIALGM